MYLGVTPGSVDEAGKERKFVQGADLGDSVIRGPRVTMPTASQGGYAVWGGTQRPQLPAPGPRALGLATAACATGPRRGAWAKLRLRAPQSMSGAGPVPPLLSKRGGTSSFQE